MDRIPLHPELPAPVDEAALEAFVDGPAFDAFLLDCFEQGIRDAVAADAALGLKPVTGA
jgi:hypothetical protein